MPASAGIVSPHLRGGPDGLPCTGSELRVDLPPSPPRRFRDSCDFLQPQQHLGGLLNS